MQEAAKHVVEEKLAADYTPRPQAARAQPHKQPSGAFIGEDGGDGLHEAGTGLGVHLGQYGVRWAWGQTEEEQPGGEGGREGEKWMDMNNN